MKKVISIDAETNGLWGQPFQVAMVLSIDGEVVDTLNVRCPIEGQIDPWVKENVLPQIEEVKVTHLNYENMLQSVAYFWLQHKDGATALWHMGHIVEAHLFRELHRLGLIGDWDAPYSIIELMSYPEIGDSVDNYLEANHLKKPNCVGGTHNALYDALVALEVYNHISA